jgi:predicted amidohydrolase
MGFFDKIKEGLAKTKKAMANTLDAIFIGGEIDDDFYEELTDCLILADLGVGTATKAVERLRAVAREKKIYLVGGSIPELCEGKVYNTSYVFDPQGKCIARHRKTHLFDIEVEGGQCFRESDALAAGRDVTTFDTPWGTMGLCICFDFRFEELPRLMALRGAKVIFVPAAFNMTTGPAHWELLFRQRAVDNQCYTVGTSPARDNVASYTAWGHSIVCEPWGSVVKQCNEQPQISVTELDMERVEAIRSQLPILSARRADLYEVRELF